MVLPLAHQAAFLKVTENKVQLISYITDNIWEYMTVYISADHCTIISCPNDIPIKLTRASSQPENCEDLDEADTIMIHHMVDRVNQNVAATIHVKCNDTDVFVLLCHFSDALNIDAKISFPHLLLIHAITSCGTASKSYGIGITQHQYH